MNANNRSGLRLGGGFLLVLFGAMPLNGFFGFLLFPHEFAPDKFIGSPAHLLVGLTPWLAGIVLIAASSVKPLQILSYALIAFCAGFFMSLAAIITAADYAGLVGWLAICGLGILLAVIASALKEVGCVKRTICPER